MSVTSDGVDSVLGEDDGEVDVGALKLDVEAASLELVPLDLLLLSEHDVVNLDLVD